MVGLNADLAATRDPAVRRRGLRRIEAILVVCAVSQGDSGRCQQMLRISTGSQRSSGAVGSDISEEGDAMRELYPRSLRQWHVRRRDAALRLWTSKEASERLGRLALCS